MAVWPPAEVLDAIEALDRPGREGVRWTTRDQWHVTLRFLGRVDEVGPVVARLSDVRPPAATGPAEPVGAGRSGAGGPTEPAGAVRPSRAVGPVSALRTFASAGPVTCRLGPSVVMLPVAGLDELAATVVELTSTFGEPPPARPFTGHVTLARARRGAGVRDLAGSPLEASWPVSEVTLVATDLHPQGARYRVVARFPLD